MRIIRAHYDGVNFVPDGPVDAAPGAEVVIYISDRPSPPHAPNPAGGNTPLDKKTWAQDLLDTIGGPIDDPHWPADGAKEFKHYLYGTPKHND